MRGLVFIFTLLVGFQASANNLFIPNAYKNRRIQNIFSAIGWSDRKEAGVNYNYTSATANDADGNKSFDTKGNDYNGHVFDRINESWNVEGLLGGQNSNDSYKSSSRVDPNKGISGGLGLGYEFSTLPIALGASYTAIVNDQRDGTSNATTSTHYHIGAVGAGYRLPDDVYLGVGYLHGILAYTGLSNDTNLDLYYVGGGKVFGDRKNPFANVEGYLSFQNLQGTQSQSVNVDGLINVDAFQPYAAVMYTASQGVRAGNEIQLKAGVDYQFMDFFVGPELQYDVQKTDKDDQSDSKDTTYSLQAGYRTQMLEAFVSYGGESSKSEYGGIFRSAGSTKDSNVLGLGLTYKF